MANCNLLAHPFKLILTSIIFFLFISSSNGQNEIECISPQKPISKSKLTINNYGIGLGGLNKLNGLNLSLIDKTCKINGLSVSLSNNFESYKTINGIDITLLSYIEKCRGLGFALGGEINELNGLATFLLFGTTWDFNGINISGLAQLNSNISKGAVISGLYIVNSQFTGLAITPGFIVSDSIDSGVMIAGLYYNSEISNGLSISLINKSEKSKGLKIGLLNLSKNHKGVQIGLLNINHSNRKLFKYLPFISLNLRKDTKPD